MNFKDRTVSMTNVKADDETVSMSDKRCKVYSLVDVDCAALPSLIRPYTNIEVNNTEMPVDLVSVVDNIPNAETVVYNQIIFLPSQKRELALLEQKENRHASIPNPSNQMAVEDIKQVQDVIARESKTARVHALQHGGGRACRHRPSKNARITWKKRFLGAWAYISVSVHTTNWNCSSVHFRATVTA